LQMLRAIAPQIDNLPQRRPLFKTQFAKFVATGPKDPALC
jgi:hypothetical protein